MNIGFLFHLYQPIIQEEATFRKVVGESYLPLVKFLNQKKDIKVTLNTPLSLLEQMDKYGYQGWISDIKNLVESRRVELVGSGAYHPLLTKIPVYIAERQIILNEFGIGYYFGRRSGFEGESAVLVKNLNGFFPPELAVNHNTLMMIADLGYKWVVVDEVAIPENTGEMKFGVFEYGDYGIDLVCRNRLLSNAISFKRSYDTSDTLEIIEKCGSCFVALDGEFLGHHYKDGFVFFEKLVDKLMGIDTEFVTVSEYVERIKDSQKSGKT